MKTFEFASFHYKNLKNIFSECACVEHMEILPCLACKNSRKASLPYTDNIDVINLIKNSKKQQQL